MTRGCEKLKSDAELGNSSGCNLDLLCLHSDAELGNSSGCNLDLLCLHSGRTNW